MVAAEKAECNQNASFLFTNESERDIKSQGEVKGACYIEWRMQQFGCHNFVIIDGRSSR